jgi:CRP-like cAMP-binding protein
MGQIRSLQTKPDRLRKDQENDLREALLPFEEKLPMHLRRAIYTLIDRASAARNKWTFVMLSPEQNMLVVRHLKANSRTPLVALELWATCFHYLRVDTGEIMLNRGQLAEQLGTSHENVSRVMSELVEFGAISRRRVRMAGLKGCGPVEYYMNPRVATHLPGVDRDKAQDDASQLRLV